MLATPNQQPNSFLSSTARSLAGIWDTFVATTIASEDISRPVWPSCPAFGWTSGVDMLTGLPNGNTLVTRPSTGATLPPMTEVKVWTAPCGAAAKGSPDATCTFYQGLDYDQGFIGKEPAATSAEDCCNQCAADPTDCFAASFYGGVCYFKPSGKKFSVGNGVVSVFPPGSVAPAIPLRTIETHGYYQHGGSWPAVNGNSKNADFAPLLPVSLASGTTRGTGYYGVYASEFGASVYSSFESMAPTLNPEHWSVHGGMADDNCDGSSWPSKCTGGNPMAERNVSCYSDTHPNSGIIKSP